jgi:salicylate hydroxylase
MSLRILIVGAGIGGLAAAVALRQAGIEVIVCERAAVLGEAGAGVTMTPPGLRAMDALGLGKETIDLSDNVVRTAFYQWDTGDLINVGDLPPPKSVLDETRAMHRSDLHLLLLQAAQAAGADIRTGHVLEGFDQDEAGVTTRFANGNIVRADAVIGCDGLRSTVRGLLLGHVPPQRTGIVAFRALLSKEQVGDLMGAYGSVVHVGPNASFVRYTVRHGEVLNCVGLAKSQTSVDEGWSTPATRAEFKAHFPDWNDYVHDLIDRIPEDQLFKWPLFDRDPIPEWTRGRVTLLGDSAHPMVPFLGIGATMALEDAVVLGARLAETGSVEEGFAQYVAIRQPRAAEVTEASRAQGRRIMGADSPNMFRKEMKRDPVFDYDVRREGDQKATAPTAELQ